MEIRRSIAPHQYTISWYRPLEGKYLLRAYNQGRTTAGAVMDFFASMNYEVSIGVADNSVGPRCHIVSMRNPQEGEAYECYTGVVRDTEKPMLPRIWKGTDMAATIGMSMDMGADLLAAFQSSGILPREFTDSSYLTDRMRAGFSRLPKGPDERMK